MKRTSLNKESKTHRQRRLSYETKKRKWLKDNPGCQFTVLLGDAEIMCGSTFWVTVHHKMKRGKFLDDERYFMTCCPRHHAWIHANSNKARELGYLLI